MMDLHLKALTEADMTAALTAAGLLVDMDGELTPAFGVSVDVIGSFTRIDYSVEPAVEKQYPDWHVNIRCDGLTEDQEAALAHLMIDPPASPYRVWAE